jgi:hypothetical protein
MRTGRYIVRDDGGDAVECAVRECGKIVAEPQNVWYAFNYPISLTAEN